MDTRPGPGAPRGGPGAWLTPEQIQRGPQAAKASPPHPFETGTPPTSWLPDRKVTYGPIGGLVSLLIAKAFRYYGVEVDPDTAAALTTLIILGVQYVLPAKRAGE